MEHDLFGKPVSTFPDHALSPKPLGMLRQRRDATGEHQHADRPQQQRKVMLIGHDGALESQVAASATVHATRVSCSGGTAAG
jgi:hypothetical protein